MTDEFVEDIIASSEEAKNEDTAQQAAEVTTDITSVSQESDPQVESEPIGPIESLASKLGWKPDHNGPNAVDAETYILRSREIQDSMRDHNRDLKAQLNDLQGSVDALKSHNDHVYKVEVGKLRSQLDQLNLDKKAAVEIADVDKVAQIDGQIDSIKQTLSEPPKAVSRPSSNPVYDDWVKDNNWYLTDKDMAIYADQVAQQYAGAPPDRIYNLVRNRVAEVWPEKFNSPKAVESPQTKLEQVGGPKKLVAANPIAPASPVEGATHTGSRRIFNEADLTQDQKSIMSQFVRQGIMTKEQYIADIAKLQEA